MGVGDGRCRCREDVGVGNGRWRCREDHSRSKLPSVRLVAGATGAAIRADRRANSGRRSCCRRLHSLVDCTRRQGREGALGYSLDVPACRFNAQSIANGIRWRCSQCCRRRTLPRSRPHFASQGACSQTSGHGRQAALLCFIVRGRCCRQSSRGLAKRCPPCASRGTR
jgi:hypothetical protein